MTWQQLRNASRRTKAFNKYDCRCMNVCGVVISMCVCVVCGFDSVCLSVCLPLVCSVFAACDANAKRKEQQPVQERGGGEGERLTRAPACRRGEA